MKLRDDRMNIKPLKITYNTTDDNTTIIYEEMIRNKPVEKMLTIKGRVVSANFKPTVHTITETIIRHLKQEVQ